MTIKRFNQTGVASNVQFGRRGGQVAWDGTQFQFSDSGGFAVDILARSPHTLSHSRLVTEDELNRRVQGLSIKESVVGLVSVANATLTEAYMQDGTNFASYSDGQRIIVRTSDGIPSEYNGIYVITGGLPVRPDDAIDYQTIEGAYVFVSGATGAADTDEGTGWVLNITDDSLLSDTVAWNNADGAQIGYTPYTIEVKQFHGQGTVTVSDGLTQTGNEITLTPLGLLQEDLSGDQFGARIAESNKVIVNFGLDATPKSVNFNELLDAHGRSSFMLGTTNTKINVDGPGSSIIATLEKDFNGDSTATTETFFKLGSDFIQLGNPTTQYMADDGHDVNIHAGTSGNAAGGTVTIAAGSSGVMPGGPTAANGGDIVLRPGVAGLSSTGIPGKVQIEGQYLALPASNTAFPHTSGAGNDEADYQVEGGLRVRKVTGGKDYLEMYDSQSKKWVKVGGAVQLSDFNGTTYVKVGDDDTASGVTGKVEIAVPNSDASGTDTVFATDVGTRGVYINGQEGLSNTPDGSGGSLYLRGGDSDVAGVMPGGVYLDAGENTVDGTSYDGIYLRGNGADIMLDAGTRQDFSPGNINIETAGGGTILVDSSTLNLGTVRGGARVNIGSINAAEVTTTATNINTRAYGNVTFTTDNDFTVESNNNVYLDAANGYEISLGQSNAGLIYLGNTTNTTDFGLYTQTGRLTVDSGGTFLSQTDAGVTIQAVDGVDKTVRLELNQSTAVIEAKVFAAGAETDAEKYAAAVRAQVNDATPNTAVVPNVEYIKQAVENAELGGMGVRTLSIDAAVDTGATINFANELPTNARVRRVTIYVEQAFDANVQDMRINAASGGNITANSDIDLTTADETYVIELNGLTAFGGNVRAIFDAAVETSATGKVHISFEFNA